MRFMRDRCNRRVRGYDFWFGFFGCGARGGSIWKDLFIKLNMSGDVEAIGVFVEAEVCGLG